MSPIIFKVSDSLASTASRFNLYEFAKRLLTLCDTFSKSHVNLRAKVNQKYKLASNPHQGVYIVSRESIVCTMDSLFSILSSFCGNNTMAFKSDDVTRIFRIVNSQNGDFIVYNTQDIPKNQFIFNAILRSNPTMINSHVNKIFVVNNYKDCICNNDDTKLKEAFVHYLPEFMTYMSSMYGEDSDIFSYVMKITYSVFCYIFTGMYEYITRTANELDIGITVDISSPTTTTSNTAVYKLDSVVKNLVYQSGCCNTMVIVNKPTDDTKVYNELCILRDSLKSACTGLISGAHLYINAYGTIPNSTPVISNINNDSICTFVINCDNAFGMLSFVDTFDAVTGSIFKTSMSRMYSIIKSNFKRTKLMATMETCYTISKSCTSIDETVPLFIGMFYNYLSIISAIHYKYGGNSSIVKVISGILRTLIKVF